MSPPFLAAENLTFGYLPESPIFEGWSMGFDLGETVAIIGHSGAGKSTLLYLLGLMIQPDSGWVSVAGEPVSSLSDAHRADLRAVEFGFVFQDAALDATRTVVDNIVETALYRRQDRKAALIAASELMNRFGVGLRATHKPGEISGGQAQRIALCRALLACPRIILADEPTGNLDPGTSELVITALREHAYAGSVVIVVTHDPSVADFCDRIVEVGQ